MKPHARYSLLLALNVLISCACSPLLADDPVFSGPQQGEKTTAFKVVELTGAKPGTERDPITENAGQPTTLVFVHGIERSLVPLLRVVDQYGAERQNKLKTEIIFLSPDRLQGEPRVKAAAGSLRLQSRVGLSIDGAEGPGNYGLNKDCLMTILIAKENKVTANFALRQPGIADAPKVVTAMAKACGDTMPPTVEELNSRSMARNAGGRNPGAMRGNGTRPELDLSKLDVSTEEGLRQSVRALIGEVQRLREELAAARSANPGASRAAGAAPRPQEPFPGAVPTDETLVGLLRRFIRPTNDDATVDTVLKEVKAHIKDSPDLRKQAIDGWTRVLHFGDRYGTEYARKVGHEFLEQLKREAK